MFVRARLSQETAQNAILAPQTGISRDPKGNATAMVVGTNDKGATVALSRDVIVDRTVGDKWLVTKGLAANDRLIVEGLNRIKPGQPIQPVPAGSKPAPPPASADAGASK